MFIPQMFSIGRSDGTSSDWTRWVSAISGGSAKSGVIVTPEKAMALSATRACVTLLAESVAQLPCELYRRKGEGRERATDHPLYNIIHNQPNAKDTSFEYYEQGMGCLGIRGNHFALKEFDNDGYIKELIPVHPDKVTVLKGPDGLPYYELKGTGEILPMRLMHHIKAFSFDGYIGVSPIQTNIDVLGLALATEEHASTMFANGAMPSGVIERPKEAGSIDSQTKVDAILNKWKERHSGLRNAFSVAMLQEGMTYKQLSMDNEKAQLLESRRLGVEEICRLYKIPLHMVQHNDKTSSWGSGIESMSLGFVIYTLLPWLKRIEAAQTRDLLVPSERGEYYIEFNVQGLLRGDQKSRYESYAIGRQWGWLSVNDIRRLENMPPITGGDRYLTPLNMVDSAQMQNALQATPEQMKEIEAILCHR